MTGIGTMGQTDQPEVVKAARIVAVGSSHYETDQPAPTAYQFPDTLIETPCLHPPHIINTLH